MPYPRHKDEQRIVKAYKSGTPVAGILDTFSIGTSTLYRILARQDPPVPLRGPPQDTLTVMDPADGSFALVDKTPSTLVLRAEQIIHAYQSGMLVADILRKWHINTKTLYHIVPPGRYSGTTRTTPRVNL